jgi:hypothetical protein
VPKTVIRQRCALYMSKGKPAQRGMLLHDDDFTIVAKYQAEYAGLVQYYLLAQDVFRLGRLHWVMETSLLKTLADKHRSTVTAMARKYKATADTPARPRKCLQVVIERDRGRKPLVARFGGIPLRRASTAILTDQRPVMASARRNELIHRLLAGRCEICQETEGLEVHHVRKLAELARPGRQDKPAWMHLMAMRRRKTLITCRRCHQDIHMGRAHHPIPEMITGEQGAGKLASPVREETDGKGPGQGHLAGGPLHSARGLEKRASGNAGIALQADSARRWAAGCPLTQAARGTGPGQAGRTRLPDHRRHISPHRPRGRRPAVLLRQAPPPSPPSMSYGAPAERRS